MRRHIVTVVVAATTTTLPAAAGVTNTITIGPDTPGRHDAGIPTSSVPGWFDGSLDSLQASGTGRNQFRLTAESIGATTIDAPRGRWNTWSTETGTNQLDWGDSSGGDLGASPGSFERLKAAGVVGGSAAYGDAGILSFTFGTGSGWAAGFDGQLGPITIGLRNGSSQIIAFAASIPVVPGPVGLATLAGISCLGSRRRR